MAATVLVTGGTGFIGKLLVKALLRRGDQVRCLVRTPRNVEGCQVVLGDVTQPSTLIAALDGVDVVHHLAGATLVRHPLDYHRVNAKGTRHLVEACAKRTRPPKIVYLSSLAAAGPAIHDRPRSEDDPPAPVSLYGKSKLAGKIWLGAYSKQVSTTIVRATSTFGPGDSNSVRLFKAAKLGLNGVPGSAEIYLTMIYADDLIRRLLLAEERGKSLTGDGKTGIYFAAMDQPYTLGELGQLAGETVGRAHVRTIGLPWAFCWTWGKCIDLVVALTGKPLLLTSDKMREAFAGSWTCETDKAKRELGFTCSVSLEEGFRKTVEWYLQKGWL